MTVLSIVLPIFLIIGLGYILRRIGLAQASWVSVLNSFVYYVSLPALIAISFWQMDWRAQGVLAVVGFTAGAVLLFGLLLFLVLDKLSFPGSRKTEIFIAALVANAVYMGFPLGERAFGTTNFGLVAGVASAHLVVGLILAIMGAEHWVLRSKNFWGHARDFAFNPLVLALVVGTVLGLVNFQGFVAGVLREPLRMLGATASPGALFALGAFLHNRLPRRHFFSAALTTGLKLVIFPILVFLLGYWLKVPAPGAAVAGLISGMPTAVTAFVLADKFRLDKSFVATAIVMSTVFSLVTISGLLGWAI